MPKKVFFLQPESSPNGSWLAQASSQGLGSPRALEELGELKQLSGAQSGARALALRAWGEGADAKRGPSFFIQAATESFQCEISGSALGETCIILGLSTAFSRI